MAMSVYDFEQRHMADTETIKSLESDVKRLTAENTELRREAAYVQKLKLELQQEIAKDYWGKPHNERNAGRKKKMTSSVIADVHSYANTGKTQREIAAIMGLSLGLVNKACNTPLMPQS